MKAKRTISMLLLTAMLAGLAACGDNSSGQSEDTKASGADDSVTTAALTGRDAVSDDLPDKNYNGKTFTIMDRTAYKYEFEVPEETGDLVDDAIYKRNTTVEDRFGIELKYYTLDASWGEQATNFNNTLRSSVMAGDGAFDLVAGYAATIPGLVSDGIFMNWNEMKYNDFTKPWWSEAVADELTINGKAYMVTGDISLALWKGMTCFFFNKKLADDYKISDIYQTVKDGKWTLDTLIGYTKDVYNDLDGDGTRSDSDMYGFLCMRDTEVDNMKEAFEVKVTEKDSAGYPKIVFKNERTVEVVTKLNAFIHENDGVLFPATGGNVGRTQLATAFSEDRGIFFTSTLGVSETLRSMNSDFGIIPYPKYDETQKSYHSSSLDEFSLFLIPMDAKDPEMTSIITEALCAESYKIVVPKFYDVALKTRNARDDDSSEMIDLIRDGLTFDWGYLHSSSLGGVGHLFVNLIRNNDNNVVSGFDANASTYEENLKTVLEVYK